MEKAVIVGQLDVSIAGIKWLGRLPYISGSPGNVALRHRLRDECQEAVSGMPAVEKFGKGLIPFGFIGPYDRLIFADRIVDYNNIPGTGLFRNFKRREGLGSDVNFTRNGPVLPQEQRNGELSEPEKQYKSSFCHDADDNQVIEKFILL